MPAKDAVNEIMLREMPHTRQHPGEPQRRWLTGDPFDLILWQEDGEGITGFQLCFRDQGSEWAYTWHSKGGLVISQIDDGEGRPGRFKMTPVLVPDGTADIAKMKALFKEAAASALTPETIRFILDKL